MVHTLRNKKVCDTSPESYHSLNGTRFDFSYPSRNHVLQTSGSFRSPTISPTNSTSSTLMLEPTPIEQLAPFINSTSSTNMLESTPMEPIVLFRNSLLESTRIEPLVPYESSMLQSTRINPLIDVKKVGFESTAETCENGEIFPLSYTANPISSVEQSELPQDMTSDNNNNITDIAGNSKAINKTSNLSSFQQSLYSCIDHVIFKRTFKKKGGVSLYAIKKSLKEEFGYDTFHFRKSIRDYVKGSLSYGNLVQVSGKGAAGSVRLANTIHQSLLREQRKGHGVSKIRNRSTFSSNISRTALMMMLDVTNLRTTARVRK